MTDRECVTGNVTEHFTWEELNPDQLYVEKAVRENLRELADRLEHLRTALGVVPVKLNSVLRSRGHPVEVVKDAPGPHTWGVAADIRCYGGRHRRWLVECALPLFPGIGVARGFVHVDFAESRVKAPRPALWTYKGG